jgi:hypothetical protein
MPRQTKLRVVATQDDADQISTEQRRFSASAQRSHVEDLPQRQWLYDRHRLGTQPSGLIYRVQENALIEPEPAQTTRELTADDLESVFDSFAADVGALVGDLAAEYDRKFAELERRIAVLEAERSGAVVSLPKGRADAAA